MASPGKGGSVKKQKLTDGELDERIAKCATYLREKAMREGIMLRPSIASLDGHPDRRLSFHDFAGFMIELRRVQADLKSADDRLQRLRTHFELGEMIPFEEVGPRVDRVRELTLGAWIELSDAMAVANGGAPPPTRAMKLQKSAVTLARAEVGETQPRRVREIARRIMVEAGLSLPDERTISNWLKELETPNGK